MKKLAFDSSNWKLIGTINDLIDLVNSQQEAIEGLLANRTYGHDEVDMLGNLAREADDTHRTVTLRIPKGMRVGEAMYEVWTEIIGDSYGILEISDTDLQKALDEVKK